MQKIQKQTNRIKRLTSQLSNKNGNKSSADVQILDEIIYACIKIEKLCEQMPISNERTVWKNGGNGYGYGYGYDVDGNRDIKGDYSFGFVQYQGQGYGDQYCKQAVNRINGFINKIGRFQKKFNIFLHQANLNNNTRFNRTAKSSSAKNLADAFKFQDKRTKRIQTNQDIVASSDKYNDNKMGNRLNPSDRQNQIISKKSTASKKLSYSNAKQKQKQKQKQRLKIERQRQKNKNSLQPQHEHEHEYEYQYQQLQAIDKQILKIINQIRQSRANQQ